MHVDMKEDDSQSLPQRGLRPEATLRSSLKAKKKYRLSTRINSGFAAPNTFTTTSQLALPPIDFQELRNLNAEAESFNKGVGFFTDYVRQAKKKGINLKAVGHD